MPANSRWDLILALKG